MLELKHLINATQDEFIEALKGEEYALMPDMRDKEGNHFIVIGKEKEIIYLALMIKKEDADEKGLNEPVAGIKEFYIEELARVFKVVVMNGGGSSPIFKRC